MKILVIGSTSVIGRALSFELASLCIIKTAGRRNADFFINLENWSEIPDISDYYDFVIHTAADFGGAEEEDFARAEVVNAVGVITACRLARKVKARHFVLISSISAANATDDPYYNIYAISKHHAEELASLFCSNFGIKFTAIRPSQVYDAAGECRRHQSLLYQMIDHAEFGEDIVLQGKNDAKRNFIFLDDLIEIIKRIIISGIEGVYNCTYPESLHLSDIANAAFTVFCKGGSLKFDERQQNIPDVKIDCDTNLYDKIGFKPRVNIVEGISRIRIFREKTRFEEV